MPYKINPDRNIPWNDLPDLPIDRELFYTAEIMDKLGETKLSLGKLQGRSIAIPNQGVLINTISLQEAKASSAIENIFTTDDELYKAFSEQQIEVLDSRTKEVLYYREALWNGHNFLKNRNGIDQAYFVDLYSVIKQASDGIRPPLAQVVIKTGGTGPNAGKVVYTPPRGDGILQEKLQQLSNFMNDDKTYKIDPIIKMAMGHYQFEAIHPFRDGNGRIGRVFNINYLVEKGLLDIPILYLSRFIIDNKDDYYANLAGVSQRGDWKSWIMYMLTAVEVTARLTYDKITDIVAAKDAIIDALKKDTQIRRVNNLVDMIFVQPFTKVKHYTDNGIYSENTARDYLNKLVEMKICEKRVISGHHYYLNLELYRILAE
ncbi:MAG: Fic family protein [Cytophagales bacterium]